MRDLKRNHHNRVRSIGGFFNDDAGLRSRTKNVFGEQALQQQVRCRTFRACKDCDSNYWRELTMPYRFGIDQNVELGNGVAVADAHRTPHKHDFTDKVLHRRMQAE